MASPPLTSSHNPRFRAALALRDGPERRRRRLILVDGAREILRGVESGIRVTEAFVSEARLEAAGDEAREALRAVRVTGATVVDVSTDLLDRLAYGDRDQGIVVVAQMPEARLDGLDLPADPLIGVIDGVEKPGNIGAILRSADGAGVDGVIVADPRTDPWNPNAIRASLGTVFTVPLAVAPATEVREWLSERGIRVVAARVDGAREYMDENLCGSLAFVLGSEAEGLGALWGGPDATAVRIPMLGLADSLNVSVSAAILFYEARRQRDVREHRW